MTDWPKSFGRTQLGDQALRESSEDYAFYCTEESWSSMHAVEVKVRRAVVDSTKSIVEVQYFCSQVRMKRDVKPRWMIVRTEYYPSLDRLFQMLRGETEVPKGKRKPRPIEPMTQKEIEAFVKSVYPNGIPEKEEVA